MELMVIRLMDRKLEIDLWLLFSLHAANELNNTADPRRSRLFTTTGGLVVGIEQGADSALLLITLRFGSSNYSSAGIRKLRLLALR